MTFAFLPWALLKYWSLSPSTFDPDFLSQHKHLLSFILTDAGRSSVKHYKIWVCLCLFGSSAKWSGWMESMLSFYFVRWASSNGVQMPNVTCLGMRKFNSSLICTS